MIKKKSYARPKPTLDSYTKPCVIAISLDPEQAILSHCRVGGLYMGGAGQCQIDGGGIPTAQCITGVRGHTVVDIGSHFEATTSPS